MKFSYGRYGFALLPLLVFGLFLLSPIKTFAQESQSFHPLGEWRTITSKYGYRNNPFGRGKRQFHRGLDLALVEGDSVYAWREGIVMYTGYNRVSGNIITILHPDGYMSKYHHLLRILVEEGEIVDGGQWIAKGGRSGQVTGPHLHFTLMKDEKYIDPLPYVRDSRQVSENLRKPAFAQIPVYKQLQIRSQPSGQRVFIDGNHEGETPLNLSLAYGEHFLEVEGNDDFASARDRIEVEQDSEGIIAITLKPRPRNDAVPDRHLDYGQPDQGRFAGLFVQVSSPNASDSPLEGRIGSNWQLNGGLAWYTGSSRWLTSPYLEIQYQFGSGEFAADSVFYPLNDIEAREDTLHQFRFHAASIVYGRSATFFDRLELLAAVELALGRWRFDGDGSQNGRSKSYTLVYFAPGWNLGGAYQVDPRLDVTVRYKKTFWARQTNWEQWHLGLLFRLF